MTRSKLLFSLLPLFVTTAACSKPSKKFKPLGAGTVTENVWRNQDLGLELTLPEAWDVQSVTAQQEMMELGKREVAGDDKRLNAELDAGSKRTVTMFSVFESPPQALPGSNANITGVAENLRIAPNVQTPEDYFAEMKKLLSRSQVKVAYPREPEKQMLGGKEFSVLYVTMSLPEVTANQRYYARRFDDFMVLLITTHSTEEQEAAIDKSMATLTFTTAKPEVDEGK